MAYDRQALHASLAAAVGENPALLAELRQAYREGAHRHLRDLATARGSGVWKAAAWRLHSLAASFGALELMQAAERAAEGPCGSPTLIRDIEAVIRAM